MSAILDDRNFNFFCVQYLVGKPEGRDHSEFPVVNGKIILEWIIGKWGRKVWTGCI
jgi:hypothetical protein